MQSKKLKLNKVKKKYLQFIKSQEVLSEPFRNKLGQLKNFFLPISKKIFEQKSKKNGIKITNWLNTKIIGLTKWFIISASSKLDLLNP